MLFGMMQQISILLQVTITVRVLVLLVLMMGMLLEIQTKDLILELRQTVLTEFMLFGKMEQTLDSVQAQTVEQALTL